MSKNSQENKSDAFFGYSFGQDMDDGLLGVASVLTFLSDVLFADEFIENHLKNETRDGMAFVLRACSSQNKALCNKFDQIIFEKEIEYKDCVQKLEDAKSKPENYPRLKKKLLHKSDVADLSKEELLFLINEARGHSLNGSAMAVGVGNQELEDIKIKLEKRGLVKEPEDKNSKGSKSA